MARLLHNLAAAGLLLAASASTVACGSNSTTAHKSAAPAASAAGSSASDATGGTQVNAKICNKTQSTTVQDKYVVMNNEWGADTPQCVSVTNDGFSVTADQNKPQNGAPAAYPAIYVGCHYTNCSPGTNLPMQVNKIHSATSSISYAYPSSGAYDAAYDIWLDPAAKKDGVNQQEMMIWFNHKGSVQPVGSKTGTVTIGGRSWDVWTGNNGSNDVVSYVASSPITSWKFSVLDFINDIKKRSKVTDSWYLTSIQAGFEPWVGGTGLAITSFSASVNGVGNAKGATS